MAKQYWAVSLQAVPRLLLSWEVIVLESTQDGSRISLNTSIVTAGLPNGERRHREENLRKYSVRRYNNKGNTCGKTSEFGVKCGSDIKGGLRGSIRHPYNQSVTGQISIYTLKYLLGDRGAAIGLPGVAGCWFVITNLTLKNNSSKCTEWLIFAFHG